MVNWYLIALSYPARLAPLVYHHEVILDASVWIGFSVTCSHRRLLHPASQDFLHYFWIVFLNVGFLQYTGYIIEGHDHVLYHLVIALLSHYSLLDGSVWHPEIIVKPDWVSNSGCNLASSPSLTTWFLEYCYNRISLLLWSDITVTCTTIGITTNVARTRSGVRICWKSDGIYWGQHLIAEGWKPLWDSFQPLIYRSCQTIREGSNDLKKKHWSYIRIYSWSPNTKTCLIVRRDLERAGGGWKP